MPPAPRPVQIALVSDTHQTLATDAEKAVYKAHFDQVIRSVNAMQVDAVVIAGDLTDSGRPEQYDAFCQQVKGFRAPVVLCPGNHDLGAKRLPASKPTEGVSTARIALYESKIGPTFAATTIGGLRVITVNTPLLGSGLPAEAAQWQMLETELGPQMSPAAPTVLLMHYPLFTETPDEAGGGYWNIEPAPRARLIALMAGSHAPVRALLSGHLHRPLRRTVGSIPMIGTPPVSFGLPRGKQAEGWTLVTLPAVGPAQARFFPVADTPAAPEPGL